MKKKKQSDAFGYRMITPVLVLLILLLTALLVYLLYGEQIADHFNRNDPAESTASDTYTGTGTGGASVQPGGGVAAVRGGVNGGEAAAPESTESGETGAPAGETGDAGEAGTGEGAAASEEESAQAGETGAETAGETGTSESTGNGESAEPAGESTASEADGGSVGAGETAAEPESEPEPEEEKPRPLSELDFASAAELPGGLHLNLTDFTVQGAGERVSLRVSGGNGVYRWFSEDTDIATVNASGTVTSISAGTVNIVVTDGERKGVCIARVRSGVRGEAADGSGTQSGADSDAQSAEPSNASGSSDNTSYTTGGYRLNRYDYTRRPSEGPFQLRILGGEVTETVTWASSNPSVARVSNDGVVTSVSRGSALVTATWGNHRLQCWVRVPSSN